MNRVFNRWWGHVDWDNHLYYACIEDTLQKTKTREPVVLLFNDENELKEIQDTLEDNLFANRLRIYYDDHDVLSI